MTNCRRDSHAPSVAASRVGITTARATRRTSRIRRAAGGHPVGPHDAKGMLASAIRGNDPVDSMSRTGSYRASKGEAPEGEYTVPIGSANVLREGRDGTIITYGPTVPTVLEAAKAAHEALGKDYEVIDLLDAHPAGYHGHHRVRREDRPLHRPTRPRAPAASAPSWPPW